MPITLRNSVFQTSPLTFCSPSTWKRLNKQRVFFWTPLRYVTGVKMDAFCVANCTLNAQRLVVVGCVSWPSAKSLILQYLHHKRVLDVLLHHSLSGLPIIRVIADFAALWSDWNVLTSISWIFSVFVDFVCSSCKYWSGIFISSLTKCLHLSGCVFRLRLKMLFYSICNTQLSCSRLNLSFPLCTPGCAQTVKWRMHTWRDEDGCRLVRWEFPRINYYMNQLESSWQEKSWNCLVFWSEEEGKYPKTFHFVFWYRLRKQCRKTSILK